MRSHTNHHHYYRKQGWRPRLCTVVGWMWTFCHTPPARAKHWNSCSPKYDALVVCRAHIAFPTALHLQKHTYQVPQPTAGVQVNGDSGNDVELLAVPGVCGCMVSNAHPELQEWVAQHQDTHNLFAVCRLGPGMTVECVKPLHSHHCIHNRQPSAVRGASWRVSSTLSCCQMALHDIFMQETRATCCDL